MKKLKKWFYDTFLKASCEDAADEYYEGFKDGAKCADSNPPKNLPWHKCSKEVPTNFGSSILVVCKNKNKEDGIFLTDLIQCWEGKWEPRNNWEDPVLWAYLDDLLPDKDETA